MAAMKRALARAIFRESRLLRKQGPGAGLQLPAIYDVCNSVNPDSGGILFGDAKAYQLFAKTCETWCLPKEVENHLLLRRNMAAVLKQLNVANDGEFPSMKCPFEVLRAFKFQNSMPNACTKTECNGITLTTVTGFAREISQDSVGENIFSYNMFFTNNSDKAVRVLGHNIIFRDGNDRELKSEYSQGVNNTMPVIKPGEHYVCGSTVAFPEEVKNPTVGGSFEIIEEGFLGDEFEKLPLPQKWKVLANAGLYGDLQRFTLKLEETKFSCDVACDSQPLAEKLEAEMYA
jgi:uncharacterized protein affecting Mg2+/Co2+ transport